jgi:transcriptional antiterminator
MNDDGKIVSITGGPIEPTSSTTFLPSISQRRQARIFESQNLYLGGMKVTELATYFGLSRKQVYADLRDAKLLSRALVAEFDSEETLGREISFLEETRRTAMRNFSTARQEGVKLGFLRLALETTSKLVALFQSTGLITVVARKIEFVESNPFTDPHFRKRFTALLLEAREAGEPIQGL